MHKQGITFFLKSFGSFGGIAHIERAAVADRNSGFYDHHCVRIHGEHQFDHILDAVGVERVFHRVVVGGSCYDHEVCVAIGGGAVESGCEVELFLAQVFFNVIVLYGRTAIVDHLHLLREDVDCCDAVMLSQECG